MESFSKLNKLSLYSLLFLIPLFFFPFTQNVLDFPKQILATILIFLSLFGWLGEKIFKRKLNLRVNKTLYLILFLIFLSTLISFFLSPNFYISFFGFPFEVSDSLLTLLLFLIFVFLLLNFSEKFEFLYLVFCLILSGAIVGIFNLFQIYGIHFLPLDFAKNKTFNPIGTPNALSLFAAIVLPISLVLFLKTKRNLKIIFGTISLILFLNVLFVNFKTAWFLIIFETLILFIFGFTEKLRVDFLSILVFLLTVSIFFYLFPISLPIFPQLPPEISLSFPAEVYVLKGAFDKNLKTIIFGTGPGTFTFNYSLYRSPLLNQTIFWGTRFLKGHSTFLDWTLTRGIFGLLTLLFLYLLSLSNAILSLRKKDEFFEIKLGLASGLIGSVLASFFYPFNFTLYFLFWFFVGSIFFFKEKPSEFDVSSPNRTLVLNSIFILTFVISLTLLFFQGQRFLAEIYYFKGLKFAQELNYDLAIKFLQKASFTNQFLDLYWRDLSQILLAKANLISQDPNLSFEEKSRLANSLILQGADAINRAISILPQNVANWNVRGFFYQNLIGIEGADKIALESYQRAIQLEPNSPYPYGEKGRIYILLAQDFAKRGDEKSQKENLNFAISILKRALELKPDYAPAHYLLAVAFDQLGESDKAISKLEETKLISPHDFGVAFQLGLLYWRKGEIQKAKEEFERALSLNPDYSNARYMLGLVFDRLGEREKAISEFEKVLEQNPGNEEVKKILENIKKGLPALEGILVQTQLQEFPPEIKR